MKIKIDRINKIVKLPEQVAFLEGITFDGTSYQYRICYDADIQKAIKNKAITVKIRFLKDELQQKRFNIFTTGLGNEEVVSNLLLQKARQKDLVRSKSDLLLFETTSDISKKIPNDQIKRIGSNTFKSVKNSIQRVDDIKKENVVQPVLEQNLAAFGDSLGINQKVFKEDMRKILVSYHTDPAAFLGNKSRTIISTQTAFNGVINKKSKAIKNILKNDRRFQLITENLLSDSNITNSSDLGKDDHVGVTSVSADDFVSINEFVEIPIDSLKDPVFVLEFEVFNNKGLSQQVINVRVNHKEKLEYLLLPVLPPTILSSPIHKPGKVIFQIKQNDPNCDKINIYKKIVPLDQANLDSNFTFVKSVLIDKSDGILPIIDEHSSINPTIYRAISVGKNSINGFEFDSITIRQDKGPVKMKNLSIQNRDTVLTLTGKIKENIIILYIDNMPSGPIAYEIYRRNLSIRDKTATRISNRILLDVEKNDTLVFNDTTAKKNRIYEYYCNLIYKNGDEAIAKNNLTIKFENVETNIVSLPQIIPTITTQNLDVQFEIVKNKTLKDIDITKKVLAEQDILTEYQDDITNEKEKLQNLFFTRVLRTNNFNGEIEDFGIVSDTLFSDKNHGGIKNIKPLEVGIDYTYTIMVYSIAAEVLFEKFTRDVTTNNKTYTLQPSKWFHPLTLNEGMLTNSNIAKVRHANSIFTFGKIADIQYVNVNLKNVLPFISNTKAIVVGQNKALVKWKISGEAKKIDHFIISLESMGSRTIVGKSHNITSTNDFQFVDILDNGEHGALKYIITPIYFDYSQGTEVSTNIIFI